MTSEQLSQCRFKLTQLPGGMIEYRVVMPGTVPYDEEHEGAAGVRRISAWVLSLAAGLCEAVGFGELKTSLLVVAMRHQNVRLNVGEGADPG